MLYFSSSKEAKRCSSKKSVMLLQGTGKSTKKILQRSLNILLQAVCSVYIYLCLSGKGELPERHWISGYKWKLFLFLQKVKRSHYGFLPVL